MPRSRDSAPLGALGVVVGFLAVVTLFVFVAAAVEKADSQAGVMLQKATGKCDARCLAHRRLVAKRMAALRKQIDQDYHSMVHFGDKAGYVPPVRSIKAQVMDGSLLGGGSSDAAAPPPFSPTLGASRRAGGGGFKFASSSILPPVDSVSSVEHKLMAKEEAKTAAAKAHAHPAHTHARSADAGVAHAAPAVDIFDPHLGGSAHVHHAHADSGSDSSDSSDSKGASSWAKMFSFMKHKGHEGGGDGEEAEAKGERSVPSTEPNVVKRAIKKALSFATSSQPRSKTEEAGDKLLGLHRRSRGRGGGSKDPLKSKFLEGWFGS